MTDDKEMHDEAQRVAMTAAMAGTRVIETVAREVRERNDRNRAQAERQNEARQAAKVRQMADGIESGKNGRRTYAENYFDGAEPVDSGRDKRDAERADLPTTPEAQEAFRLADVSTGYDPDTAAAAGRKGQTPKKTTPAPEAVKVPEPTVAR